MTLEEFLRREAELPAYAGACCRMADRWAYEQTGFSPIERFGRQFHTRSEVDTWLAEPGGLARPFLRVMHMCGFRKTTDPQSGDVGLIVTPRRGVPMLAAAIKTKNAWVSRDDDGFFNAPADSAWLAWELTNAGCI